jgi:hypothetical protein
MAELRSKGQSDRAAAVQAALAELDGEATWP